MTDDLSTDVSPNWKKASLTTSFLAFTDLEARSFTRKELHARSIEIRGFQRSDGLYEVEGRMIDRKSANFTHRSNGKTVPANEPIHDLGLRIVFDDSFVVREIQTFTESAPYPACPEGGRALQSLKGLVLGRGWNREVRLRLAGARSCTHLMELLGPLATTAFQTLGGIRSTEPEPLAANGRPVQIDSCYAYAADGELVKTLWPHFHQRSGEHRNREPGTQETT